MLYGLVNAHLARNARMLIVNTFHVFDKLPEVKVPEFIIPCLTPTFDSYTISKKVQSKALAAKSSEEREDFDQIQIGNFLNTLYYLICFI
jgi:hypothetical protein